MRTQHAYRLFLLLLMAAAAFVVYSGFQLKYYGVLGPGPGFFPVWTGGLLVLGCAVVLVQSAREGRDATPFFEDGEGALRVLVVVLALAGLWLGLLFIGFRLAMLAFVFLVPRVFGPQRLWPRLVVALLLSFGVAHVFEKWLQVELPSASIEALQVLDL